MNRDEEIYNLYIKDLRSEVDQFHMTFVRNMALLNGELDLNSIKDKYLFEDNCQRVQKLNIFYAEGGKTDSLIKLSSSKDEAMQHINTFIAVVQDQLGWDVEADSFLKTLKRDDINSNIEYRILFLRYEYDVLEFLSTLVGLNDSDSYDERPIRSCDCS